MSEVLSPAALDTVTTMAFGRKVLMIGSDFGQDVLTLAQAAQVLIVMPLPRGDEITEHITKTAYLKHALEERRLAGHVLFHSVPWDQATGTYLVDQFDLVVVNPHAIDEDDPAQLINHVVQFAETIIVIEAPGRQLWDTVTDAVRDQGMICSGDGAIIVARPMPTEPVVRQD